MKIKKSGWIGRAKVAFVLSVTVILSLVFIEGNSQIEQSEKQNKSISINQGESTIVLYWGDEPISLREGLSYSEISKPENKEKLNYVIEGVTDEILSGADWKMRVALGRDGKLVKLSNWMKVERKKPFEIEDIMDLARAKDVLEIETFGVSKGRFISIPINE